MSNREMIISLLDNIPDYKLGYVLAYVQGISADEAADDAFCEKLLDDYKSNPDPDKKTRALLWRIASENGGLPDVSNYHQETGQKVYRQIARK